MRVPQKPSPISLGVSCADPAEHHPRCSIVARSAVVGATPGNPTIISAASTPGVTCRMLQVCNNSLTILAHPSLVL